LTDDGFEVVGKRGDGPSHGYHGGRGGKEIGTRGRGSFRGGDQTSGPT